MLVINPIAGPISYIKSGESIYIAYSLIAIVLGAFVTNLMFNKMIEFAKQSALMERG